MFHFWRFSVFRGNDWYLSICHFAVDFMRLLFFIELFNVIIFITCFAIFCGLQCVAKGVSKVFHFLKGSKTPKRPTGGASRVFFSLIFVIYIILYILYIIYNIIYISSSKLSCFVWNFLAPLNCTKDGLCW